MKIFVVSWFYPPVTTSEAFVTYKLLSNSKNEYYLCSASSSRWSYNSKSELESDNIKHYTIDTDDFDEFNERTVEIYKKLSKKIKFDAIMTRSMPVEPQKAGFEIKKFDKDIPWIVSLADPIGNNPYETLYPLYKNRHGLVRRIYRYAPNFCLSFACNFVRSKETRRLSAINRFQNKLVKKANLIIVPTKEQGEFIVRDKQVYNEKCLVVPHSYSKELYAKRISKNDKFVFSFIGQSDAFRSIEPVVKAIKLIKDIRPEFLDKIKVRLIGNIPNRVKNMIYVYFLQDVFSIEGSVNYFDSLKAMQESDCLIHIDALFPNLPNDSIFFAAKIADYMGAGKPILGITNPASPAGKMIKNAGGVVTKGEQLDLAKKIMEIVDNPPKVNEEYCKKFEAKAVAKVYDSEIERRIKNEK